MSFISKLSVPLKNSPFYSRPLCLFCSLFLLTLLAVRVAYVWFLVFAIASVVYATALFVCGKRGVNGGALLGTIVLVSVLCGTVASIPCEVAEYRAKRACGEGMTVTAVVTDTLYEEAFGSAYRVEVREINGISLNVSGTLEIAEQYELFAFDTVTVVGDVSCAYDGLFGAELYNLKAEKACLSITSESIVGVTDDARSSPSYLLYKVRNALCKRFDRLIGGEASSYAKALVVGEKSGLSDDFRKDMSALGVSHILAVSGMHLSIIAAIVGFLAESVRSSRKTKALLIIVGSVAFMALAGFSPSVVRAAIMLIVSSLSVFFGRRADPITSLFVSGTVICTVSPETVLSCSFLLSFFATLGLVLCASAGSKGLAKRFYASRLGDMRLPMRLLRGLLGSLLVSLCATLFTAPILSVYFSEVSVFAVVANLAAVPCAFASVALAVVILVFGNVPILGHAVTELFCAVYRFLCGFASFCSDNFETSFSLKYKFFIPVLMLALCAMLFMRLNGIRSAAALTAVLVAASMIFVTCVQIYSASVSDRNEVVYLADKTSEALVVSSGDETMLIDIGRGGKSLPTVGVGIMQNEYYETRPDAFMLTHYHSLHIGTVRYLVCNYRIKRIYVPEPESENDKRIYRSMEKYLSETQTLIYKRGESISVGAMTVSTTEFSLLERSTHPVISVKISVGKRSLLWVGSSVTESDIALTANRWLSESSVVICGGHGPKEKENIPYYTVYPSVTEIFLSPYVTANGAKLFNGTYFETLEANDDGAVKKRFSLS